MSTAGKPSSQDHSQGQGQQGDDVSSTRSSPTIINIRNSEQRQYGLKCLSEFRKYSVAIFFNSGITTTSLTEI